MLARVIFCVIVAAAVLAVILLATVSPIPHRAGGDKGAPGIRTFTVYVHPTVPTAVQAEQRGRGAARRGEARALVFHHRMTAGPESTSRTVGAASGFLLLPAGERGAAAAVFDTVHLAFDGAAGMSGSLCVETSRTNRRPGKRGRGAAAAEEVLQVVGGTGAFAFARGHAVLRRQRPRHGSPAAAAAALLLEISVSSAGS
ncbi:unnamed protein product [Urochloa humidicola]